MVNGEKFILKKVNNDNYKMTKVDADIEKITISKNVLFMKKDVFSSCYKLKDVYYEGTLEDWCKIKFSNDYSNPLIYAKNFYIKENDKYQKVQFESIIIPNGEEKILNYSFLNLRTLKEITIPKSIKKIGIGVFSGCSALQDVYYCGTLEDWCNITFMDEDSNPFSYAENFYILENNNFKKVCELDIPTSVIKIGKYQFFGFSNITKIMIPDSVKSIGEFAFSDCCKIKEIIIPKNLKSISQGMFERCTSLEKVDISDNTLEIDDCAFGFCESLKRINISKNIAFISNSAFFYCDNLEEINVDPNNLNYSSIDGSLYTKDEKKIILCAVKNDINSYEINGKTEIIGEYAFENKKQLTEIKIPESVTKINDYAFGNCTSLKSITIPKSVKEMGKYVFYKCDGLIVNCNMKEIPKNWHFNWNKINIIYPIDEKAKEVIVIE